MFSSYTPSAGKNLSDAIGGIIKKAIRNGIMMRRLINSKEMGQIDVDDIGLIEMEGEEFNDYDQFFKWLDAQVKNRNIGVGPKFKTFDIINICLDCPPVHVTNVKYLSIPNAKEMEYMVSGLTTV